MRGAKADPMPSTHTSDGEESGLHTPFSTGERVTLGARAGVIVAAFPDGFHLVRMDDGHQLTGAHFSQLIRADDQPTDTAGRASDDASEWRD
jgi:hypothetical protein